MKITKIVVASHNKGKIKEIKTMLSSLNIEVVSAVDLRLPDVEETGTTFEENAKLKAQTLCLACGIPCLADDSGLCVEALEGRPGVYSARYAPDRDFDKGMEMLLKEMDDAKSSSRKANFSCCLAFAIPNEKVKIFEGVVNGTIAQEPKGANGFGYDPIFIPEGYEQTFAELGDEVKNGFSHRKIALEKFVKSLKE